MLWCLSCLCDHQMSVFRCSQYWRVPNDNVQEYNTDTLVYGDVENDGGGTPCVCIHRISCTVRLVTGSLSGLLTVYNPTTSEFSPMQVVMQEQMEAPILNIGIGCFTTYG